MIKSEESKLNRHRRSPARPLVSQILRDGRARELMPWVSGFRRLASCIRESEWDPGEVERRRWPLRTAADSESE